MPTPKRGEKIMLPKLHPLHKTFVELRRSRERIANYRLKANNEDLAEIEQKLVELIHMLNNYK
jgi:hypothetical protein